MPLPLHTRTWGRGRRRLLLLHGITWNTEGWWRVGPDLAALGYEVTAADLRGHGRSPRAGDYTLGGYTADVAALGSGWDGVVGHSLGGAVAVLAQTADPGFARRLILQDPALLMAAVPTEEAVAWLVEPYRHPRTVEAVAAESPTWHPEEVRRKLDAMDQCPEEVVEATVRDNPGWNLIAETAALGVPTTIVGGDPEHGGIVPVTIGEWFAAENPMIDYVVLEGSGHSAHREPAVYDRYLETVAAALEVDA
ncbi:MAG: alpha/beta hydrolase [Actinobacteria bacterium]|nr:alpha/beta hydrolase [Actinomycetota bacterium]